MNEFALGGWRGTTQLALTCRRPYARQKPENQPKSLVHLHDLQQRFRNGGSYEKLQVSACENPISSQIHVLQALISIN